MKDQPLVSVVIPTFRRPDQLSRAVRSVLGQSYPALELIVVDDDQDSVGGGAQLIRDFNDGRLKYLKNQRQKGGNGARNTGVVAAQGKYVAFLDDDDEWYPNKLALQVERLESLDDSWGAIYCGYDLMKDGRQVSIRWTREGLVKRDFMLKRFRVGASSTLVFRRDVLLSIGMWDERLPRRQEVELLTRMLRRYKLAVVSAPLLKVYGHNESDPDKVLKANDLLYEFIKDDVRGLTYLDQRLFFAEQHREMAWFLARNGQYAQAFRYCLLSFINFNWNLFTYAKVVLLMVRSLGRKPG